MAIVEEHRRDARVRGGEREERSADPRTRQEEQPVGGEGQMRHHVNTIILQNQPKTVQTKQTKKNNLFKKTTTTTTTTAHSALPI